MPNEARSDDATEVTAVESSEESKGESGGGSKSYTVKGGDSLSEIAQREMGDGDRWKELYEANKAAIGDDPDVIQPGTELTIPA